MSVATNLKLLRKDAGLTQRELAQKVGLPLRSIINYENGLREPNSKAMAALERYFNVSGEYLRGEIDKAVFFENSDAVNDGLDQVIAQIQRFKGEYLVSDQAEQLLAAFALAQATELITKNLLHQNKPVELSQQEIIGPLSAVFNLNAAGRSELVKRAEELLQLSQYRK